MTAILYLRPAAKALARLTPEVRKRIVEKIEAYARDPAAGAGTVKALRGLDSLRLRVGDYRVVFRITGDGMEVAAIGHRRDIYEQGRRK